MTIHNFILGIVLSILAGSTYANAELSSLVQWQESNKPSKTPVAAISNEQISENIKNVEATAAEQALFSSLIQWEKSQHDVSYVGSIDDINKMEATAAGSTKSELSSLIQWKDSVNKR